MSDDLLGDMGGKGGNRACSGRRHILQKLLDIGLRGRSNELALPRKEKNDKDRSIVRTTLVDEHRGALERFHEQHFLFRWPCVSRVNKRRKRAGNEIVKRGLSLAWTLFYLLFFYRTFTIGRALSG